MDGSDPDVLGEQRHHIVDLEGADHEEREIGGVREALLVKREHLLTIERIDALGGQRLRRVVIRRVDLLELLGEHLARRPAAVGDGRLELALEDVELLRVVAGCHEILIEELEARFEIRRRGASRNAVARQRDKRRGIRNLPREQLLEVPGFQATGARRSNVVRRQSGFLEVCPATPETRRPATSARTAPGRS